MLKILLVVLVTAICAAGPAMAQSHNDENEALLGVVAVEEVAGRRKTVQVVVAHVLADSPAAAAGIQVADVLLRIGKTKIESAPDVDAALGKWKPGDEVALRLRRDKQERKVVARLIARSSYEGKFLARRRSGQIGFAAPDWYVYAWSNVAKKAEPPTRASTRGKVVVFHAFQSW